MNTFISLLNSLGQDFSQFAWSMLIQSSLVIIVILLWVANTTIRRVREQAVDEWVMVAMNARAIEYPEALVKVARVAMLHQKAALGLVAIAESKNGLKERVSRLLNQPVPSTSTLGLRGAMLLLVIGALLLPMAQGAKKSEQTTQAAIENQPSASDNSASFSIIEFRSVLDEATPDSVEVILPLRGSNIPGIKLQVDKHPSLDLADVRAAFAQTNPVTDQPEVRILFTGAGRKRFAEFTRANVHRQIAIFMNGQIQSAPNVNEVITSDEVSILSNLPSPEAATALVDEINHAIRIDPKRKIPETDREKARVASEKGILAKRNNNVDEAIADFTEALRLDPQIEMIHYRRGQSFQEIGQYEKAQSDFEAALKQDPEYPNLLQSWAWQLAACPTSDLRDGKRALEFALKANKNAGGDRQILETVAAAYAELGQFEEAVSWQERALQAFDRKPSGAREALEARLSLYEAAKPYRL